MKDFNKLSYKDLLEILHNKEKCVIIIDQITSGTIGFPQKKYFEKLSIYNIPETEIIISDMLINDYDKQSIWNSFILKASKIAHVQYININDVDCQIEIDFF